MNALHRIFPFVIQQEEPEVEAQLPGNHGVSLAVIADDEDNLAISFRWTDSNEKTMEVCADLITALAVGGLAASVVEILMKHAEQNPESEQFVNAVLEAAENKRLEHEENEKKTNSISPAQAFINRSKE